jgi:FixJ family two-component response regulator
MTGPERSRILVVDDEEAILETMTYTFEDDYQVLTASSASQALDLLERDGPVAVVISDQRMPEMTGVEFLSKVFETDPTTARIILTGFADMNAIIRAINDGHVYAYITKPWEPADLKQVVRRAVDHHALAVENERLMSDLQDANVILQAVMDQLDTGAIAIDAAGVVRAANGPVRDWLGLERDPRGRELKEVLETAGLEHLGGAAVRISSDEEVNYQEVDLGRDAQRVRLRITVQTLNDLEGRDLGRVILAREISHEPLRRRFDELLAAILESQGEVRGMLEKSLLELRALREEVSGSTIESPGMAELGDRISRSLTAIEYWLEVDDSLAREDYPEAQLLLDRTRIAMSRWPLPDQLPARVRDLARRVESYYESGENSKQRTL